MNSQQLRPIFVVCLQAQKGIEPYRLRGNLTKYWKAKIPAKPLISLVGAAGFLTRRSNKTAMFASGT